MDANEINKFELTFVMAHSQNNQSKKRSQYC